MLSNVLTRFMNSLEPDDTMILISVNSTLFHGRIQGGAMPEGSCGLIACSARKCPSWLKKQHDQADIDIDAEND